MSYLPSWHCICSRMRLQHSIRSLCRKWACRIIQFFKQGNRIWLVEVKNHIVGSIAIVGRSRQEAQLRWFFVHPSYRGHGIGRKLLREALHFSKRRKYKTIFLWTTSELDAADISTWMLGSREQTRRSTGSGEKQSERRDTISGYEITALYQQSARQF